MNKEQIQKELTRARAAETTIKNNIIELLEQLVEAEKPKLRHGDFGIEDGKNPTMIVKEYNNWSGDLSSLCESFSVPQCNNDPKEHGYIIFGNIFDLLKEWSEDLEEWDTDQTASGMKIDGERIKIYFCTGVDCTKENDYYDCNLSGAEEIWRALGREIATLKKKQS